VARLFKSGRSQAVRIPKEWELPGDRVLIYRDGNRLILQPTGRPSLTQLLASWEPLCTDVPSIDDRPPEPVAIDYR
jgi:antitoxin VapB